MEGQHESVKGVEQTPLFELSKALFAEMEEIIPRLLGGRDINSSMIFHPSTGTILRFYEQDDGEEFSDEIWEQVKNKVTRVFESLRQNDSRYEYTQLSFTDTDETEQRLVHLKNPTLH